MGLITIQQEKDTSGILGDAIVITGATVLTPGATMLKPANLNFEIMPGSKDMIVADSYVEQQGTDVPEEVPQASADLGASKDVRPPDDTATVPSEARATVEQQADVLPCPVGDVRSHPARRQRAQAAVSAGSQRTGWRQRSQPVHSAKRMIDTRVNTLQKDTVDSFITWREVETNGITLYPGFICRYAQHLLFFDTATDYRYCTSQEAYDATEANRAHLQTVLDLQEAMKVRVDAVGLEMRKAHALQALYAHIDSIVPPVTAQEVNAPGADRSKLLGGPLYARVQMFGHSDDLSKAIVGELLLCTTETCLACTSSVDMLQSHADGILSRLRAQGWSFGARPVVRRT